MVSVKCMTDMINFLCVIFVVSMEIFPIDTIDSDISMRQIPDTNDNIIRFVSIPSIIFSNSTFYIEYKCTISSVIRVDVRIWTPLQENAILYSQHWNCFNHVSVVIRRKVNITLPNKVSYGPSHYNKQSVFVKKCVLGAWMYNTDISIWKPILNIHGGEFIKSVSVEVPFAEPYHRPSREPTMTPQWWIEWKYKLPYQPQCLDQSEVYKAFRYPIVLSGTGHGFSFMLPEYTSPVLKKERQDKLRNPLFTMKMLLYVEDYCPHRQWCSLIQRLTWDDLYMTPMLYVNASGILQVKVVTSYGKPHSSYTLFKLPLRQWTQLVFNMKYKSWSITVDYGENFKYRRHAYYTYKTLESPIYYDDTDAALHIFGGSENIWDFKGFIGEAAVYRRKWFTPEQLGYPGPDHPIYKLELDKWRDKCYTISTWYNYGLYKLKKKMFIGKKQENEFNVQPENVCSNRLENILSFKSYLSRCMVYDGPLREKYELLNNLVKDFRLQKVIRGSKELFTKTIYKRALKYLEYHNPNDTTKILPILQVASCLGNHDATFLMAAIYNEGLGQHIDEPRANQLLMQGALDEHTPCTMALANKHLMADDDTPFSIEHAYAYYKNAAESTRIDWENHNEDEVYADDLVRLTDDWKVEQITDEDGDAFVYYKHRAQLGDVWAIKEVARLLYWGQKGLKRDIVEAVRHYKLAADMGDVAAQYDYGICLIKGQGTELDMEEAVKYLSMAADQDYVPALNTLGWYAMNEEKNYTKALHYFERAYKWGNEDAAHNLGLMHYKGLLPDGIPNKTACFEYYFYAATHGQMSSAIMVAMFEARGHPDMPRDVEMATDWARYTAEKNPAIAVILSNGLVAYKNTEWSTALLYYALASFSGAEVAHFNLAYLCEEDTEDITYYLGRECMWRHYNFSVQRLPHQQHPYASNKMGDYHWYGYGGQADWRRAAHYYGIGASIGNPQSIFNLASMAQDGIHLPNSIMRKLRITKEQRSDNHTLLIELYSRCKDLNDHEAYIACTLALYHVQFTAIVESYWIYVQVTFFCTIAALLVLGGKMTYNFLNRERRVHQVLA